MIAPAEEYQQKMRTEYLTPKELCARYRNTLTETTLANWRASGQGPAFLKAGGRVLYSIDAVMEWEAKRTKTNR